MGLKMTDISRTPRTAEASTAHSPIGKPGGPGLFHHKGLQLPAYIQHVAKELMKQGHPESEAIGMAVGIVKNWAAGHDGHGNPTHPDVQAAAAKAVAQWEKAKAGKASRAVTVAERAEKTAGPEYDSDGLDSSWDGDLSDLPDMNGLGVSHMEAAEKELGMAPAGADASRAAPKLGSGARFAKLKSSLAAKGASDPGALAAYIGRRKYGKAKFSKLASHARGSGSRSEQLGRLDIFRSYPLEDMHIVTRGEGDGSGRLVEAYCAIFDEPTEIRDQQGHYQELIDRSAFNKRIADVQRSKAGFGLVKCIYNHGMTLHGTPAERFSMPCAVTRDIRTDNRGVITRAYYLDTDLGNEVLEMWRSGAITAQSFSGPIIRSSPDLPPGGAYRSRAGRLQEVRRLELGLKEFGGTPFPYYAGAELVGVRMSPLSTSTYGAAEHDDEPQEELDENEAPPPDGVAADATEPPSEHSAGHDALVSRMHALSVTRGVSWKRGTKGGNP